MEFNGRHNYTPSRRALPRLRQLMALLLVPCTVLSSVASGDLFSRYGADWRNSTGGRRCLAVDPVTAKATVGHWDSEMAPVSHCPIVSPSLCRSPFEGQALAVPDLGAQKIISLSFPIRLTLG